MAKSRQVTHTSSKILRTGRNAMRAVMSHVTTNVFNVVVRPALRPMVMGLLLLALLTLAVVSLGRLQLWMTGAGLLMVALSIASAVQELQLPKTVPSYPSFLDEKMEECGSDRVMLPHLSPGNGNDVKKQQQMTKDDMSSMTLDIASASSSRTTLTFSEKTSRRQNEVSIVALESAISSTVTTTCFLGNGTTEVSNKLDVLHCGTVIDIQGSLGFIIPHDLRVEINASCGATRHGAATGSDRPEKQQKMPLVIPFSLNEEQTAARQEITVGKTVEFAYSHAAANSDSPATLCALNVTPVPTDDGIVRSRSALQSCKQAREVSFARAMEELTIISPRNVPVKHHVDLIKYAEELDDHDSRFG